MRPRLTLCSHSSAGTKRRSGLRFAILAPFAALRRPLGRGEAIDCLRETRLPTEDSAPKGLELSGRGQRPRETSLPHPHPLPPLPDSGERGAGGGVWGPVRGFHPRLLNLLPSGEHVSSYAATSQSREHDILM